MDSAIRLSASSLHLRTIRIISVVSVVCVMCVEYLFDSVLNCVSIVIFIIAKQQYAHRNIYINCKKNIQYRQKSVTMVMYFVPEDIQTILHVPLTPKSVFDIWMILVSVVAHLLKRVVLEYTR